VGGVCGPFARISGRAACWAGYGPMPVKSAIHRGVGTHYRCGFRSPGGDAVLVGMVRSLFLPTVLTPIRPASF